MSLNSSSRTLHDAMRTLTTHWRRTREQWDDTVARRFHRDHLESLEDAVRHAMGAMDQMADAIHRARTECERDG